MYNNKQYYKTLFGSKINFHLNNLISFQANIVLSYAYYLNKEKVFLFL